MQPKQKTATKTKRAAWMCAMHSDRRADVSNNFFPSFFLSFCRFFSLRVDSMCWLFPVRTHRLHFYDEPSVFLFHFHILGAVVLIGLGVAQTGSWIIQFMEMLNVDSHLVLVLVFCASISFNHISRFSVSFRLSRLKPFETKNLLQWKWTPTIHFFHSLDVLQWILDVFSCCFCLS